MVQNSFKLYMYKILLGLFFFIIYFLHCKYTHNFTTEYHESVWKQSMHFPRALERDYSKKVHQEHLIHYSIHKTELRKKQEVKVPSIPPIPSFPFAKLQCCYPSLLNDSNNSLKNQVKSQPSLKACHLLFFFSFH